MGELQKRIKEEIQFDNYIGWKETEAFQHVKDEVLRFIEEMRKEFPELLIVTEDAEVADILKYVETVYHWREKWLGNSEQK